MKTIFKHTLAAIMFVMLLSGSNGSALATGSHRSGSPDFLYYMEGTGAYFLPDADADVFFSRGRWYRRSGSSWSSSISLSGPWGAISISDAPSALVELPIDFRTTISFGRVPYRHVVGSSSSWDDYGPRYYSGRFHDDHESRGFRRQRHPTGGFWFFIAPELHFEDRNRHDDDWDDDGHRRRRRGRGRGRD